MRLFTKYNRINVASTIIIFLAGSIAFSVLLRYVILSQIDEDLKIEKNEVITYVNRVHHLPDVIEVPDQYTTYEALPKPQTLSNNIYTHESVENNKKHKELQRTIKFEIEANGVWYIVSVSKSLNGTHDLIQTIIIITVTIILSILTATFLINRIVLRRLWQPFYSTLQTMQQFNLTNTQTLNFGETGIDEFRYLNTILSDALGKAQDDYKTLKEFTENASHELQTPLAIIQSKLDLLIQNEKLSEAESQSIQSAYSALNGLKKLNQSLLLLAKIENKQFGEQTIIDVRELLELKITEFNELWKSRNITTEIHLTHRKITGNKQLVDSLLNNVLSNATKHNVFGGTVTVLLNESLQISNTGMPQSLDVNQLYKRFSKHNNTTVSYGLGLSIIQQICIASGFKCVYNFKLPHIHVFTISF